MSTRAIYQIASKTAVQHFGSAAIVSAKRSFRSSIFAASTLHSSYPATFVGNLRHYSSKVNISVFICIYCVLTICEVCMLPAFN